MPLIIVILVLGAFTGLAWRDLKIALTLILALLPAYLIRFDLVIPWTLLEGLILVAFGVWVVQRFRQRLERASHPGLREVCGAYRWPLLFLLVLATAAAFWAPSLAAALGIWKAYYLEPLLMFVMLRTTFDKRQDWIRALTGLGITTVAIAGVAIFQKLTGLGLPIPWDVERRATSIFSYPNAVGLFVAPVVSATAVIAAGQRPQRGARMLMIVFGVIAIVLAQTEAAMVAIPAALLVIFMVAKVTAKIKLAVVASSVIVAAVFVAGVPMVREKVLLQDYSGGVRRSQWTETVTMLKDRPLQGAGLSGYPAVFAPYHDPRLYEIFQYPHNVILNFWVELGLLGVVAFLWMAITTGKLAVAKRDDVLVLAAFAALLTMSIHGLVDVPFFKNDLAVLTAFFLAMMLAPLTGHRPDVRKN